METGNSPGGWQFIEQLIQGRIVNVVLESMNLFNPNLKSCPNCIKVYSMDVKFQQAARHSQMVMQYSQHSQQSPHVTLPQLGQQRLFFSGSKFFIVCPHVNSHLQSWL